MADRRFAPERFARAAAEIMADLAFQDLYTDAPEYAARVEQLHAASRTGIPVLLQATQPAWLYRTEELDDDGDPLDFGVVSAETREEAVERLAVRLGTLDFDDERVVVRLYRVVSRTGVWESDGPERVTIHPRPAR